MLLYIYYKSINKIIYPLNLQKHHFYSLDLLSDDPDSDYSCEPEEEPEELSEILFEEFYVINVPLFAYSVIYSF